MANMQWSPFVLILMGQCFLCVCCLYQYHFVQQRKTWDEAQTYCRERYTDLATVLDTTDMKTLRDLAGNQGDAWIGLCKQNVTRRWHWSVPGVEFDDDSEAEWRSGEPNNINENCSALLEGTLVDIRCEWEARFACYDEIKKKTFYLINELKSWLQAQSYCREKHTDLASGPKQLNNKAFKKEVEPRATVYVWIGAFADNWRWSDGSNFRHWDPKLIENGGKKTCASVSDGNWNANECNETKPFFCYNDEVILIKKSMTWEKALTYCRENHRELVSITNAMEQIWVQERANMADSTHVWVGLRYSCTLDLWFWVTDEAVKYKNWKPMPETDDCDMSGAMETGGQHKWFKKNANMEFNFICFKR